MSGRVTSNFGARSLFSNQATRFLLVGAWNTLFGYSLFCLLTWLLTDRVPYAYIPAAAIGHVISVSVAFVGHRRFVFRSQGPLATEFLRCHLVYAVSFLVNFVLLLLLVPALEWTLGPRPYVPYLAGGLVTLGSTVVSFFGHKHFSFAPPKGKKSPEAGPATPPRAPHATAPQPAATPMTAAPDADA